MGRTSGGGVRRPLGAVLGGLVVAAALTGCGIPFASAPGGGSSSGGDSAGGTDVGEITIVCESGIVDHNGVETSSMVIYRAAAGTPVPPGCHLG